MSNLYSETILEYAKNPPNKGVLSDATASHHESNRSCGDSLTVYLKLDEGSVIRDFSFEGDTAIVTTACAAILGESIIGMKVEEVLEMTYEDIKAMIGSDVSPRRKPASCLGLLATRNCIHAYLGHDMMDDFSDVLV